MTIDSWLSAAEGRRERVLVPVADGRPRLPQVVRLGRAGRDRHAGRRRRRRVLRAGGDRARSSATPAPTSSGATAGSPHAWPATPDETTTAACRRRTSRRCSSAGSWTSRRRRSRRRRSCSRTCRTATRSCCPASGTRTTSGRTSRRRARTCSRRSSPAAGSTTRATSPQKVDFTPEVTQTALGKGLAGTMVGLADPDRALAAADGPPGLPARALRAQGERDAALASTRSCSAWAAGSSAC